MIDQIRSQSRTADTVNYDQQILEAESSPGDEQNVKPAFVLDDLTDIQNKTASREQNCKSEMAEYVSGNLLARNNNTMPKSSLISSLRTTYRDRTDRAEARTI